MNFLSASGLTAAISSLTLFCTLYYLQIPFIEKFKSNSLQWPWQSLTRPQFIQKLKKDFKVYFTNLLVLPLLTNTIYFYLELNRFDLESYPTLTETIL